MGVVLECVLGELGIANYMQYHQVLQFLELDEICELQHSHCLLQQGTIFPGNNFNFVGTVPELPGGEMPSPVSLS